MKQLLMGLAAIAGALTLGAVEPSIVADSVSLEQDPVTRIARLSYALADGPAVVTVDIYTNGVNVGSELLAGGVDAGYGIAATDRRINCVVSSNGVHEIYLRPAVAGGALLAAGEVTVRVQAWSLDNPPDWMVVDLLSRSNVCYYADRDSLPEGPNALRYRTTELLLRKIPARNCKWVMGSPDDEGGLDGIGSHGSDENRHYVTLTNDFYLGVYEFTVAQHSNSYVQAGMNYYKAVPGTAESLCPVDNISYALIRGTTCDWPDTRRDQVDNKTFLGFFRKFTGVQFDLPTEAEWEYACRAGTGTAFNDGTDSPTAVAQFNQGATAVTCEVGGKQPNGWGLYDMHGNAGELCMDYYTNAGVSWDDQIAPEGPKKSQDASLTDRVLRGGNVTQQANYCRSAKRLGLRSNTCQMRSGFRLWCPAEAR